jgi:hypothetical protein
VDEVNKLYMDLTQLYCDVTKFYHAFPLLHLRLPNTPLMILYVEEQSWLKFAMEIGYLLSLHLLANAFVF